MLVPVISFSDMQMIVVVFSHSIVNSVLTSILVWMGKTQQKQCQNGEQFCPESISKSTSVQKCIGVEYI